MAAPEYPSSPGSRKNLGSAYWFLFPPAKADTPLPEGAYAALEDAFPVTKEGKFKGGLGTVQVVRYTDTPVGEFYIMALPRPAIDASAIWGRSIRRIDIHSW